MVTLLFLLTIPAFVDDNNTSELNKMSSLPIGPIPSHWHPISIVSVKAVWKGSSGISYFTGSILEVCN